MVIVIIFSCLCIIVYQDLRYRHIHIALPIILFFAGIYLLYNNYKDYQISMVLQNTFFLLLTFGGLLAYMSIKVGKFLNPFQNYFGLGDLLFYLAVTPLFLLNNYVVFFISSLIFTVLIYFAGKKNISKNSIPLAGYASLLLIGILMHDVFSTPYLTLIN